MLKIKPLDGPFGVEATGIDLAAGFDDGLMRALVGALHEHRVLVIRGQTLTQAQYLAFGRQWGEPIPHVLDHLRMPGYPELMAVGNTEAKDAKDEVRNGAAFWHTDQSYEKVPSSATMLHAVKVPRTGGETLIADMAGAYDALDEGMKARIEGLRALHFYGAGSGRDGEKIASPLLNEQQTSRVPPVPHLLARPHPVTGRKALYAVAGTPYGIEGMAEAEARDLLAALKRHALQPRFIYKHQYRVGDINIYDTGMTLHSGVPIDMASGEDNSRLLWRISVRGRPKVCDTAAPQPAAAE